VRAQRGVDGVAVRAGPENLVAWCSKKNGGPIDDDPR
jgi:hypothetical protein